MIYLPVIKLKTCLIILLGIIILHFCFISTKSYDYGSKKGLTEEQYNLKLLQAQTQSLHALDVFDESGWHTEIEVHYFYVFPEYCKFIFYIGYFSIITYLILAIKVDIKQEINED